MVVSREFVALKELDGGLVKLNYDNFVQEAKAFNVVFRLNYLFCELGNLVDFTLLGHKVGLE